MHPVAGADPSPDEPPASTGGGGGWTAEADEPLVSIVSGMVCLYKVSWMILVAER